MNREELNLEIQKISTLLNWSQDNPRCAYSGLYSAVEILKDIRDNGIDKLKRYTVQIIPYDKTSYLNEDQNDGSFFFDDGKETEEAKTHFTKTQINYYKQLDYLAIDWDKAIIKPVNE